MYVAFVTLTANLLGVYTVYRFMRTFFDINNKSVNRKKEFLRYFEFYIAISAGHIFIHKKTVNLITHIVFMYLIAGCYEKKRMRRMMVALFIYGMNIGVDFMVIHLFSDYHKTQSLYESLSYVVIFIVAVIEILYEKFFAKNKEKKNMPYKSLLVFVSVICMALIYFLEYGIENRVLLVLAAVSILLIEVLILCLYDALAGAYNKLEKQTELEKQILMYSNQLDVLTQSEGKVIAFRHDMKNHLAELASMAKVRKYTEIEEYIREMGVCLENPKEFVNTGNRAIDSLMNYFLGRAKELLHKVDYEITIPAGLKISAFNLNVILGNLMENAIEASCRSEDKWLSIRIFCEKGMLFVNIRNSYSHELNMQNNRLLSTKQGQGHGIGLDNVEKMIEQYHGIMEISNADHVFEVDVILYI